MSTILEKPRDISNSQEIRQDNVDTEEYTTRLELLYEVAQKASSYSEVLKLIESILVVTQRILQASASSLFLIDEEQTKLGFQVTSGQATNTPRQVRLDVDSGIAGWVARNGKPVIANDVSLDNRFNKDIDEFSGFVAQSIIAVPLVRGHKVIGVLEVLNTADGSVFHEQDLAVLTGFASTEALILLVSMAAAALHIIRLCQVELNGQKKTIETLAVAADVKDPYAYGHSQRVREYTLLAANSLSFSAEELQVIEFGALLHDIGKIGIEEYILRKPGSLTHEEWYIMHKHSSIGANIVGEIPFLEKVKSIVLSHHEWYNGKGYPEGLKGEDIHIGARLVAVADAFDTMTTDHSYRAALSVDEAINELIMGIGTQFCPVAVEAFVSAFRKQTEKLAENEAEPAVDEEAKIQAEEAKKLQDAEYAEVWKNKGKALNKLGRYEEALEAFVKSIELDPKCAATWNSKGTALGRLGRDEEALEAFVKAIELDPRNVTAWSNKVTALYRLGRDEEAGKAKEAEKLAKKQAEQKFAEETNREAEEARKAEEAEKLAEKQAAQAAKEEAKIQAEYAMKAKETDKLVKKQAAQAAKEEAKRQAEYAKKAKEAEKLAKKQAEQAAKEQAKREAEYVKKTKEAAKPAKKQAEQAAKEEAKIQAEYAMKPQPAEYVEVWSNKVTALGRLGRDEEAGKAKDAEKLAKKEAEQTAEDKAKKKTEVNQKIRDAEYADELRDKGTALVKLGRNEEALAAFFEAIEHDPKYAATWRSKIKDLVRLGGNGKGRKAKDTEAPIHYLDSEIFEGEVRLTIKSSGGFEQVNQFRKCLRTVENLSITLDNWSEDEGIIIVVSVRKPMPLGLILSQIPVVEQVYKENKKIVAILKTPATSGVK